MSEEILVDLKMRARELKQQRKRILVWIAVMKKADIDTTEIEAEL